MTILIIVESPAKSKTIANYAGPGHVCYATFGHFRDLPRKELGVDVDNNFRPTYHITKRKTLQFLRQAIGRADTVILATDPDREGEAIAWHVTQALKKELKSKKVTRTTFNEITRQAVQNGLAHPRQVDQDLVNAQQARRILDRLVGYLVSPVLWRQFRQKGLSAGRVQTAALRLVVERDREIEAFTPEEYWTLDAILFPVKRAESRFQARLAEIEGEKTELKSQGAVDAIITDLDQSVYVVERIKRQRKQRKPAPPFTTSTLQQAASGRLNWPAKKTMKIAQQLFEGVDLPGEGHAGLITYMRTDSVQVAAEAQQEARRIIVQVYGDKALPGEAPIYKSKSANAQEAHEAIRPTSPERLPDSIKQALGQDQYKLYRLIWQRFIASQMKPAVYNVTTIDIAAPGKRVIYTFRATGRELLEPGFLTAYSDVNSGVAEGENAVLPRVEQGGILGLDRLVPQQHFTQPPPHYTEASLIKAMEKRGIGRPSTYAGILNTIEMRNYVRRQGKAFIATQLGRMVLDFLVKHFEKVFDLGFTARMEAQLDQIAGGKAKWKTVIRDFYDTLSVSL